MDIKELERIMIEHSFVLRAIPRRIVGIYDIRHAKTYPDGKIQYLEEYGREMLVVERVPKNAGKFMLKQQKDTSATVDFNKGKYFNSIEKAIDYLTHL